MTTPLKALIQERLRAKLGRHEEDAAGALEVAENLSTESIESHRRNGNTNSSSTFARPAPHSPEFQRHPSMPLPRRFPVEVAVEDKDEHEGSAFLPRHRRPRTHRHHHHHHHHDHRHPHKHQPLTSASAPAPPEPRMPPSESPWGVSRKSMHLHRINHLDAKDNDDDVRGPSLVSERMTRSHQQPPPAPAPRPRFEPYKSRYEYDQQQQQQQRRIGYEERNPRPERYQNSVAKSSVVTPNRPFRSSSSSQERARYKAKALGCGPSHQVRDLERARDRSIEFAARSRVPEHRHARVQSFRTVDTTAEVEAAYPRTEFPAAPGMQLLEPAGPSPDARSQPRVRSYESTLSPDSRLAAKAFVDKRRRRAGSSTPRTMATQRWLQSLDAPEDAGRLFFSPDIIL